MSICVIRFTPAPRRISVNMTTGTKASHEQGANVQLTVVCDAPAQVQKFVSRVFCHGRVGYGTERGS